MICRDILDWVGEPYTIKSFAKEAEKRGCCRKIPGWAPWMEPGKSRVFLVHRGSFSRFDKGVIFGYYELAGGDVVMSPDKWAEYKGLCHALGYEEDDGFVPPEITEFWRRQLPANGLPVAGRAAPEGSRPSTPRKRKKPIVEDLVDFLLDCKPPPMPLQPFHAVSTLHSSLEEDRQCGARPMGDVGDSDRDRVDFYWNASPGVYLVDTLTQEIDLELCELLKELLKKALKSGKGRRQTIHALHRERLERALARSQGKTHFLGDALFTKALKTVARRRRPEAVPANLAGCAERRGGLVLFNEPYPFYHEIPQAAFRGYHRIDGEDLMRQIVAYYRSSGPRRLEIPHYVERLEDGSLTWSGLSTMLGRRTGLGQELSRRVLTELSDLIRQELAGAEKQHKDSHPVRLQKLGKFYLGAVAAHPGIDPKTGKTIHIGARNQVYFKAWKSLKEIVN